jgi:lipid-A-disaccharide synthase
MREAGAELIVDSSRLAVVGLSEVLVHYPAIASALKRLQQALRARRPALLILVDYVEFNLRLAKAARGAGCKVLFYISPQIWAWRSQRVKTIGARVDMMAVLFPFEVAFYERHGIPVRYVGHPLLTYARPTMSRSEAQQSFRLDPRRPVVGLLPGSRRSEIQRLLPLCIETARRLHHSHPGIQFLMPLAATLRPEDVAPYALADHGISVIDGQSYDVMQVSDALVVASGTATLEAALLGVPMAIVYKMAPLTYWVAKRLVRVPFVGLANIVAGKPIAREFIQAQARPAAVADEIERILRDPAYRNSLREELGKVRGILEQQAGDLTVAEVATMMIEASECASRGSGTGMSRYRQDASRR